MKTLLLILIIFTFGYTQQRDSLFTGQPITIIQNRGFGLTIDTTYKVCKCHWKAPGGFWVTYYGGPNVFYPIELGYLVHGRYLK